jgi:hypothetical protein
MIWGGEWRCIGEGNTSPSYSPGIQPMATMSGIYLAIFSSIVTMGIHHPVFEKE